MSNKISNIIMSAKYREMPQDIVFLISLALLMLFLGRVILDSGILHVSALGTTMNDQVGYLSVARQFSEHGVLQSDLVYPSTLNQGATKNYLYMPGYYVFLGFSMKLFGDSFVLLPGYIAFVVAMVCLYLVTVKIYRRKVGLIAAVLFCTFPSHVIYANAVMVEIPFLAATLMAFCLYVYTPKKLKFYVSPLLLVIPFVFRETGALLVIPMAAMLIDFRNFSTFWKVGGMILLSVVVLMLIYNLEFSSGRPSLMIQNLFGGKFSSIYSDAFWTPHVDLSWLNYGKALAIKAVQNSIKFMNSVQSRFFGFEMLSLTVIFVLALIVLAHPKILGKWDAFLVGVTLMFVVTLLLIICMYAVLNYRGLRNLMFVVPFLIVGASYVLCQLRERNYALGTVFVIFIVFWGYSLREVSRDFSKYASLDEKLIFLFEQIDHDDQKMLVASYDLALPYVAKHKTKWSFIPANDKTLRLLGEQYSIGTYVVSRKKISRELAHVLGQIGLLYKRSIRISFATAGTNAGEVLYVYQTE